MTIKKQTRLNHRAIGLLSLTLFFALWLPGPDALATSLYVSDTTLEANLRTGTKLENRIIGMLRPGTLVTLLREEDGWAEVSLEDGRTGWILKRYLSERPPWRVTAERLTSQNERLQAQLRQIRDQYRELDQQHAVLKKQLDSQQGELQTVSREYEELTKASTNYLNLKMAYENLQNQARQNKANLEELEKAYKKLKLSTNIRWFLSGAGVLFFGGLLGSSMARMRRRRGDYYKL